MPNALAVLLVICGGIVTTAGAVTVLWWLVKPRIEGWAEEQLIRPVRETHHQVTVNSHSSSTPTVLDKLADLDHAIRSVRTDVTALTVVLDEHLHGSTD